MRWLYGITNLMDMSLSKFSEIVKDRKAWHFVVHGVTKIQTPLSDTYIWASLVAQLVKNPPAMQETLL